MAESTTRIKQLLTSAMTAVTSGRDGVRGPLRGRDFMLDDQTSGADRDGQ